MALYGQMRAGNPVEKNGAEPSKPALLDGVAQLAGSPVFRLGAIYTVISVTDWYAEVRHQCELPVPYGC